MDVFNKHYIRINGQNRIIKGFSDAFEQSQAADICINTQGGRHFTLNGVINPPLMDMQGIYLYKWDGTAVVTRTDAEKQVDALPARKADKVAQSKTALADYLASHPLLYTDGKHYSVTAEKQSMLNNAIAVYQIAKAAGQTSTIRWNATGEECTTWTEAGITALALAIAAYVAPLVSRQQALEVLINACTTMPELEAITIDYSKT